MTGDGFQVEPGTLVAHAGGLGDAAETVRSARSAAGETQLHNAAYGPLLSWLPQVMSYLQDSIITGLAQGERSIREAADDMRLAAKGYVETDLDAVRGFRDDRLA
jgi:excreted virulence factor EspC (type VII ESX diderm)